VSFTAAHARYVKCHAFCAVRISVAAAIPVTKSPRVVSTELRESLLPVYWGYATKYLTRHTNSIPFCKKTKVSIEMSTRGISKTGSFYKIFYEMTTMGRLSLFSSSSLFTFPKTIIAMSFHRIWVSVSGFPRNWFASNDPSWLRRCFKATFDLGSTRNLILRSIKAESVMSWSLR
jgi:hypothetical protein